jgi:hypothetical protein
LGLLPHDQKNHDRDRDSCKTTRPEKYVGFPLPNGESGTGIDTDRYEHREIRKPVNCQQTILASNLTDEASCAAVAAV